MLTDLQNSVITAIILVVVIILFFLGGRASIFIGIAIPFSFLVGILGLNMAGLTLNIVVLFSLILAVGMLVDDAIIVSEFAERRMSEGMKPREAYAFAASAHDRPGGRGDADPHRGVLAAPLLAGHRRPVHGLHAADADRDAVGVAGGGADLHADARRADRQGRMTSTTTTHARRDGLYMQDRAARHPPSRDHHPARDRPCSSACRIAYFAAASARASSSSPMSSRMSALVLVHARGNLSLAEKDRLVRSVEARVLDMPELSTIYARSGDMGQGNDQITEDVIGQIQFEFVDWQRAPAGGRDHGRDPRRRPPTFPASRSR